MIKLAFTQVKPFALHANGYNEQWEYRLKKMWFDEQKVKRTSTQPDYPTGIHFFTVSTTPDPLVAKSLNKWKVECHVEPIPTDIEYTHRLKLEYAIKHLKELKATQMVCFTDAFDLIFQKDPRKLLLEASCYMKDYEGVFAGEASSWCPEEYFKGGLCYERYFKGAKGPFVFINSGFFVGRAGLLLEIMQAALDYSDTEAGIAKTEQIFFNAPRMRFCDQSMIRMIINKFKGRVTVDWDCKLCLCLVNTNDYVVQEDEA